MVKTNRKSRAFFEVKYEGRTTWKFEYFPDNSSSGDKRLKVSEYFPAANVTFRDSIVRKDEDIIIGGIEKYGRSEVLEDLSSSYKKQNAAFSEKLPSGVLELILSAIDYYELKTEGKPHDRYCVKL